MTAGLIMIALMLVVYGIPIYLGIRLVVALIRFLERAR